MKYLKAKGCIDQNIEYNNEDEDNSPNILSDYKKKKKKKKNSVISNEILPK